MKSNTILACSLIIASGVVATATAAEWETTYARYHRNLSKAGKGGSTGSKSSKGSGSGSKSSKSSRQTLEPSSSPSIDQITSGPTPVVTVDSIAPTTNPLPDEPCDFSCVGGGSFPNPERLLCEGAVEGCPFGEQTCQDLQNDLAEISSENELCLLTINSGALDFCCAEISSPSPTPDQLTLEPTNDVFTSAPTDILAPSNSPTIFSKSAKGAKSSGSKSSKSTASVDEVSQQSAFTIFKNWWN